MIFWTLDLLGEAFRLTAEEKGGENEREDDDEERDEAKEAGVEAPGSDGFVGDKTITDVLDNLGDGV